eukprot:CAMPEP_0197044504 /NCGR_PEP_ID=MMETSP1384-20130603/20540_1 /TAXON_ID=29189 /ORGANISM="Ammonia sp." /LENGTH=134 /DNA_ID=CAMNT_0042475967 /DNA_START=66 /DNA_END=470 /DNA_ORIENTATION=-
MGCGGSSEQTVELDLNWSPSQIGDYILDLEEADIRRLFEGQDSKPKEKLIEVLELSVYYYLLKKNQSTHSVKAEVIEKQMQPHKGSDKIRHELIPIATWMEDKMPKSQRTIQPDDYAETVGKWFDQYTAHMNEL